MKNARKGGWMYVNPDLFRKKFVIKKVERLEECPPRGRMIQVEGYKAFFGMMDCGGRNVWGEWLYKPETDCWYCRGSSYPAEMCRILTIE